MIIYNSAKYMYLILQAINYYFEVEIKTELK